MYNFDSNKRQSIIGLVTGFHNSCEKKVKFSSRRRAKKHKKIIEKEFNKSEQTYKCPFSNPSNPHFHVGKKYNQDEFEKLVDEFNKNPYYYMNRLIRDLSRAKKLR